MKVPRLMRRLYLHVGRGKTGTSSIQSYLHDNPALLSNVGVHYPLPPADTGEYATVDPNGIWLLYGAQPGDGDLNASSQMAKFRGWLDSFPPSTDAIVSCEGYWGLSAKTLSQMNDAAIDARFQPVIVAFIREQFDFIKSWYTQSIRKGRIGQSFSDMVSHAEKSAKAGPSTDPSNYATSMEKFAGAFGENSVKPNVYEKGSSDVGVLQQFAASIDRNLPIAVSGGRLNEGFGVTEVECARLLRSKGVNVSLRRLAAVARKRDVPFRKDFEALVAPSLIERFRACYIDSNEAVRSRWFSNRNSLFNSAPDQAVGGPPTSEEILGLALHYLRRYPDAIA